MRRVIGGAVFGLFLSFAGCQRADHPDRDECEDIVAHVISLSRPNMPDRPTTEADVAAYQETLKQALGDRMVTECLAHSRSQGRCAKRAATAEELLRCK